MRRAFWIIFGLGVLGLAIGPVRFDDVIARPLRSAEPAAGSEAVGSGAFKPLAVYRTTNSAVLPRGLQTHGSWIDGDEFQGTHTTPWYRARRNFSVMVCGYPALAPNRLEIEFRRSDGSLGSVRYDGPNPGETWLMWDVSLPVEPVALRLRGVDASSAACGWLAFSEPFSAFAETFRRAWPLVQILATACLAVALLYGPGLVWLRRCPREPRDLALALLPGPLLLAMVGAACWLLGGIIAPATVARIGLLALLAWVGRGLWLTRAAPALPRAARTVIAASGLLVGFAVAKASLSFGPSGELFHGTVSRTLEVGGHSDSRISYHLVQLVAAHAGPFSKEAEALYSPWSFASRGPLAGLLAAPIVLGTGASVTADACQQPWHPFDRQGFAAYRISQIVLASLAAWAVFAAVAAIASVSWALLAANILLLSPFFVHELYFTWPKLATAAFVLAAFVLAHARRPVAAGLVYGCGYLFHPLALLVLPFFALGVLAANPDCTRGWRRLTAPTLFSAAVAPIVAAWMLLGRFAPLRTGAQAVFLDYFRLAHGGLPATAAEWWSARWANFANTFIPLHLFTVDRAHESINSVYGRSDAWVQAAFLYWNTLPFALGLPAFALLIAAIVAACRRAPLVVAMAYIGPALLLIIYWGAASTGLMRHCGHLLFVSTIVLGVWALSRHAGAWRQQAVTTFVHPLCFGWRGLEVALVAFGTTLLNARPAWAGPFGWSDALALTAAAGCLFGAVSMVWRASRDSLTGETLTRSATKER